MARPLRDQVIALAGVAQAAKLVDQVARTGDTSPTALEASVRSLFSFEPESTEAVFGSLESLSYGLDALDELFSQPGNDSIQSMARYISGILYLERKLATQPEVLDIIRSRLDHVAFKAQHFTDDPNSLLSSIAGLYQDTISKFRFRIHVTGNPAHLRDDTNAERIRTLLLCGIRSAILWRQVGGRRWRLLLQKSAMARTVKELKQEITP